MLFLCGKCCVEYIVKPNCTIGKSSGTPIGKALSKDNWVANNFGQVDAERNSKDVRL